MGCNQVSLPTFEVNSVDAQLVFFKEVYNTWRHSEEIVVTVLQLSIYTASISWNLFLLKLKIIREIEYLFLRYVAFLPCSRLMTAVPEDHGT